MQKLLLSFLVFFIMIAFASADYLVHFYSKPTNELNAAAGDETLESLSNNNFQQDQLEPQEVAPTTFIETLLNSFPQKYPYKLISKSITLQLFETFDMSSLPNVEITNIVLTANSNSPNGSSPLKIYEITSAEGQPELTFLNIRLTMAAQIESRDQLNEVSGYGESAFFYNSPYDQSTAFLITKVGSLNLAFQYNKEDNQVFDHIKQMIEDMELL